MKGPSIMGYHVKTLSKGVGRDFITFEAQLLYRNTPIATLTSKGDGGSDIVDFYPVEGAREQLTFDMKMLIREMGNVMSADALARGFTTSPQSAVSGFVNLLFDLETLYKAGKRAFSETPEDKYYVVFQVGDGWFNTYVYGSETSVRTVTRGFDSYITARKAVFTHFLSRNLTPTALAILVGDFDWHLSLEQYVELYRP